MWGSQSWLPVSGLAALNPDEIIEGIKIVADRECPSRKVDCQHDSRSGTRQPLPVQSAS